MPMALSPLQLMVFPTSFQTALDKASLWRNHFSFSPGVQSFPVTLPSLWQERIALELALIHWASCKNKVLYVD
jgi:hypothetical protein